MNFIKLIEGLSGNYHENNSIYISPSNAIKLIELTENSREILELLVTPFLINKKNRRKYELHYYEVSCEISDDETKVVSFPSKNILPAEIINNISPKIYVNKNDYESFKKYFENYFISMNKMIFSDDEVAKEMLKDGAELFYELY